MSSKMNGFGTCLFSVLLALMAVSVCGESGKIAGIRAAFSERLEALYLRDGGFGAFCDQNPDIFSTDGEGTRILVRKERLILGGKSITIGAAYTQVLIRTPIKQLVRYLESPSWFRALYNLDADACMEGDTGQDAFRARIFKRVPLLPNQDFVLGFSSRQSEGFWFQRARLVEDRKGFAVRDNLKILEAVEKGTVYREISFIYPRKWWARAGGPTFRKVMRRELKHLARALACIVEGHPELDSEAAAECWEREN